MLLLTNVLRSTNRNKDGKDLINPIRSHRPASFQIARAMWAAPPPAALADPLPSLHYLLEHSL
ncbi:MAG: hypothetical protein ABI165_04280 [Bryobacteraceae bacterium]